jgi:hypothetical protein
MAATAIVAFLALGAPIQAQSNGLTAFEASQGFKPLFDGRTLAGWTGWRRDGVPGNWNVEDGTLKVSQGNDGGDIRTLETYGDFDLRLEWKVSPGGNSGIIYRCSEDGEASWHTGPEYQVYDDYGAGHRAVTGNSAGALYDMYVPSEWVLRQAGRWNETRIVILGNHVQHWLNGVKVVDGVMWSDDWNARLSKSKFRERPGFARYPSGYIALQDHGADVWYRHLRIRNL